MVAPGDGHAEHISDQLSPEGRARAAVGDQRAAWLVAALAEYVEVVAQAEGDRLQDRAVDVRAGVAEREAAEDAARGRIEERGFLAEDIGEQGQAVGAGREGGGFSI